MQPIRALFLMLILLTSTNLIFGQKNTLEKHPLVNVFLGSSGDHGQMSPAASYPFSSLSIAPQTYPTTHTGYEYLAKEVLGFTHNRFEGVGCMGSGGVLLVKPFLGVAHQAEKLIKSSENAGPGYYKIGFTNGIKADFVVNKQSGLHHYIMPAGKKGFLIDLGHAFNGAFVKEVHTVTGNAIEGWIEGKTTCHEGIYKVFFHLKFDRPVIWKSLTDHQLLAAVANHDKEISIEIGFSTVNSAYAAKSASFTSNFSNLKQLSAKAWDELLNQVEVKGDPARKRLFYSLLYRSIQSPYVISEPDGTFPAIDGTLHHSDSTKYHGWAIWDNYKTQLPLLSILYPKKYGDIVGSIANLYPYGKKNFAGKTEPSNTVRTEHAMVVILDALKKGYAINLPGIKDSLLAETSRLDFSKPDKALESSYDLWAISGILKFMGDDQLSGQYLQLAREYRKYWTKDFKDMTTGDVDRMGARNLYQGTLRQYRWAVPFDVEGLIALTGGKDQFTEQLDVFFDHDYFNRTNEPDLQTQMLYLGSNKPWKYQSLVHQLAVDTVIQHYFNDNSRGVGSFIDRVYKNDPKAYIRTMDDDAGAMSSWFVLTAIGIQPACVGSPIYYLNVPLFESIVIKSGKTPLSITVNNYNTENIYIQKVTLNGKSLDRTWITHDEIQNGGELIITASKMPNIKLGVNNLWISHIK
jgi:putative alpha-1,2-mannosidase